MIRKLIHASFKGVILLLVISGCTFLYVGALASDFDVTFTLSRGIEFADGTVTVIKKGDIPKLVEKKILSNGLELMTKEDKRVRVFTVADYRKAIAKGAFAATTYAMGMEGKFTMVDKLLSLLKDAGPVPKEDLEMLSEWTSDLNKLPASLLLSLGVKRTKPVSDSVNDYIKQGKARFLEKTAKDLKIIYDHTEAHFSEFTKADLKRDGTYEILVWAQMKAIGGTLGAGKLIILQKVGDRFQLYPTL